MISVVIPAYNAAGFIKRAIDSVLTQSYSDYEIIVVDDGSSDMTGEIAKSYGDKVKYIHQENAGASVARNRGIETAQGEWVAFLDADDEWKPEKLQRQMELLGRNSELRWCATNYILSTGRKSAARINIKAVEKALAGREYVENIFTEAAKGNCSIGMPTVVVQKKIFEEIGDFEPGRTSGEDTDMWLRIAHQWPAMGFIAEPLVIVHLDVSNDELVRRRLESKKGENERILMRRHLKLADELGHLEEFRPYAFMIMRNALLTTLYNGYKTEVRQIIAEFPDIFPWYWRAMGYLLSIFPRATSKIAQALAWLAYKLGLERQVSRRWLYGRKSK